MLIAALLILGPFIILISLEIFKKRKRLTGQLSFRKSRIKLVHEGTNNLSKHALRHL